ncbi:MAG TPA: molybdate ABC transporter substrate-binding protein [Thermoanaerobaculia bacterium]|nr:molybdate ABC transporter substrate-binding protein [Thermoanaerobaculia bacterium]
MRRLLLALLIAPALHAAEVRVFAAASLTDALRDIAARYERLSPDRIVVNLGGSSLLERQIEEGAPADLFLSADEEKMDRLQRRGLIDRKTRVSVLSNTLVIVGKRDLLNARTIAIAEPSSVPAGIYAREYLMRTGIWDRVKAKVIPTENVRGALAAVEAGNADSAIVYRTDALMARRTRIAYEVPRAEGPAISYPFAVTANAESRDAARKFLAYLTSRPALEIFQRYGFLIIHR